MPRAPRQRKGIVLDVDGTLIDSLNVCRPWGSSPAFAEPTHIHEEHIAVFARPNLPKFLDFCFERFAGVGIWTASDASWCEMAVAEVLSRHRDWCFCWSQQHCSEHSRDRDGTELPPTCKRLRKVSRMPSSTLIPFFGGFRFPYKTPLSKKGHPF